MEPQVSHQQMNSSVLHLIHYTVIISEGVYRNDPQSYVNHTHSHTHLKNEANFI